MPRGHFTNSSSRGRRRIPQADGAAAAGARRAGRPRAKNEPSADDKLLRGREFSLEEVLKARDYVFFSGFSINKTQDLVKIKRSWIGVGLKRVDGAANLVRLDRSKSARAD